MSKTPEQNKINNFLEQIKKEQKNREINLFKNILNYKTPNEMLEYLHDLKKIDHYNQETSLIEESYTDFKYDVKIISESDKKKQGNKNIEYC